MYRKIHVHFVSSQKTKSLSAGHTNEELFLHINPHSCMVLGRPFNHQIIRCIRCIHPHGKKYVQNQPLLPDFRAELPIEQAGIQGILVRPNQCSCFPPGFATNRHTFYRPVVRWCRLPKLEYSSLDDKKSVRFKQTHECMHCQSMFWNPQFNQLPRNTSDLWTSKTSNLK